MKRAIITLNIWITQTCKFIHTSQPSIPRQYLITFLFQAVEESRKMHQYCLTLKYKALK